MKIFIVGGLGYVGGRLACHLREVEPESEIILSTTRHQHPSWSSQFKVVNIDLGDAETIRESLNIYRPDVIIHLGSIPQEICNQNKQLGEVINVEGTKKLVRFANDAGVKKIVYMSSFQVYGTIEGNISEEKPFNPLTFYAQTKVLSEQIIKEKFNGEWLVLRLSNAYGAPMDYDIADTVWGLVFNAFCIDSLQKGKIVPRSNAFRDFIAMSDVLRAISFLILEKDGVIKNEIFNLGGECCLSICEVAKIVSDVFKKYYHKKVKLDLSAMEGEESLPKFQYNISKLKQCGFSLSANMEEEVHGILKHCEGLMR